MKSNCPPDNVAAKTSNIRRSAVHRSRLLLCKGIAALLAITCMASADTVQAARGTAVRISGASVVRFTGGVKKGSTYYTSSRMELTVRAGGSNRKIVVRNLTYGGKPGHADVKLENGLSIRRSRANSSQATINIDRDRRGYDALFDYRRRNDGTVRAELSHGVTVEHLLGVNMPDTAPSGPTEYFVRVSGNDGNDGKSATRAFRSIAKATSVARAGDTVNVGAGTYTGNANWIYNGANNRPIKFLADTTGAKTGDAGTVTLNGTFEVRGHFTQIEGFKITGSGDFFKWKSGYDGLLKNCEVTGGNNGLKVGDGAELHVLNCRFHHCGDDAIDLEGRSRDYYRRRGYEEVLIENCEIAHNGDDGIDVENNRKVVIKKCDIHDNRKDGIDVETRRYWGAVAVIETKIYNNGDNGVSVDDGRVMLENCLVYGNRGAGVTIEGEGSRRRRRYTDYAVGSIWHCTITNNAKAGVDIELGFARVMNSIVTFNGERGVNRDRGYAFLTGCLLYGNRSGDERGTSRYERSNIYSDPKFVSSSDFRLRNGSPAIDAAYASRRYDFDRGSCGHGRHRHHSRDGRREVEVDLIGTERPIGRANDIGCYEGGTATTSEYFVRTDGNDNNDGRSARKAFRTIGKAASVVDPGDTVYIGGGKYTERTVFSRSGTEAEPIRFVADTTGAKTGVSGAVKVAPQDHATWVWVVYADHNKFEGFTVTGEDMTYVSDGENRVYEYPYAVHVSKAGGEVTFENCEFTKLCHPLHTTYTGLRLNNCDFYDNIWYSFIQYYGGLIVDGCNFTGTGHGPYSYRGHYTHIKNSRIKDLKGWSLLISFDPYANHKPFGTNTPTIENCQIENNYYGLHLTHAKTSDRINFVNTKIKNPKSWELYLAHSEVAVTGAWRSAWPIENNNKKYGILTWRNKLRVSDVTFEGYSGQAFYSRYDELQMRNVTSRNNYRGLDVYYPRDARLQNVRVVNNGDASKWAWGLHLIFDKDAKATLTNCQINNNRNAVYVSGANKENLILNNTTIANNITYGLYASNSDIELSPRTMGRRWRLSNNGYGLVTSRGKTLLDSITLSGNSGWGAVLHYDEATVRNCNFTGNGNGLYLYHNKKAEVTNCHFDDNTRHGLAVAANGKYYDYDSTGDSPGWKWMDTPNTARIRNCTMDRNHYGLYVNRSVQNKLRIDNSPIRDNRSAGLYFQNSEFELNPRTMSQLFKLSGNQNFIFAGNGKYTFENLEVAESKAYGIHTWYSDVLLRNCDFSNNGNTGFYSYYDKSLDARNCTFTENGWAGLRVYSDGRYHNNGYVHGGTTGWQQNDGPLRFVNCDVSKNYHGMYLYRVKDDVVQFTNTPIHDNTHYGLYVGHSELTFNPHTMANNWRISNNRYHIVAGYGKYDFRDIELSEARAGAVSTHYSDVTVKNCRFVKNGHYGFQSYYNKSFSIEDSECSENSYVHDNGYTYGTGMHVTHGRSYTYDANDGGWAWRDVDSVAVIKNTPIKDNGNYGLRIGWGRDNNIQVVDSPITGHRNAGLYVSSCQFNFTPDTMGSKWQLSDNGSHIYASWGTYLFEGLTLTGAPHYGAATWGSDVTVKNCKFNENGNYGFHSHYDKLLVENSEFNNNRWAGLTLRNTHPNPDIGGAMTIRNSQISGNGGYAMYLPYCSTKTNPIKLENTPISNNYHGVYFNQSDLELKPGSFVMDWNFVNNTHSMFVIRHGKTLVEDVTITGANSWALNTAYGEVTLKNANISGNGSGAYLHANTKSTVENCTFNDNKSWGVWVRPYYGWDYVDSNDVHRKGSYTGPVTLTNVESKRNGHAGLGVYDYAIERDSVVLDNMTIADNKGPGVQFQYLKGELNQDTFKQFGQSLKSNGAGIALYNSNDVAIKGLTISGNTGWGCYSYYCDNLSLQNCSFSGNGHGFYWYPGWWNEGMKDNTITVNNCNFNNNSRGQGLLTYWGKATVTNSTFNNNYDGFYTGYNTLASVENCEMKGNSRWGVVLHVNYAKWYDGWLDSRRDWYQDNVQTLKSCVVDGNQNGVLAYNAKNEHFSMEDVAVTNSKNYGMYLSECKYTWDTQQHDNVVVKGNHTGLVTTGSKQGDVVVKNLKLQDCKQYGIRTWHSHLKVENSEVDGGQCGVYWYRPKSLEVTNSRFDGSNRNAWGWAAHGYGGPTANDLSTVNITNSVFNNYQSGVYTYVYGDEAFTPELYIYNNTFANLASWGAYASSKSAPVVRNNIFAHAAGSTSGHGLGQYRNGGGNMVHSHNLLNGFSSPYYDGVTDPNETTVLNEPRFKNEASGDFRLGKGSPAINSGVDLSAYVPYDMEGNVRPSYKVFEIGAYEYTDNAGSFRILDWSEKK